MRNRVLLWTSGALAAFLWAGLVLFMNRQPPSSANQTVFLLLWGLAVTGTTLPLAYVIGIRLLPRADEDDSLLRAARQGLLAGIVAMVLMALQFMRLLNLFTALLLVALGVAVEVLLNLRKR
jgi:hypothetical protein